MITHNNMTNDRDMWRQRDPIPPAYEPCKNDREEREYDLALSDPNRCFGRGIKEDPLVVWIDRPKSLKRDWVWAHNNFSKAIAKMLGFTHTWIMKSASDMQYVRDNEGRKLSIRQPGTGWLPADRFLLRKTDMHITLRLGTDLHGCRLSARAYVVLDKNGNPERYMTELARRFEREAGDRQLGFWRWQTADGVFSPDDASIWDGTGRFMLTSGHTQIPTGRTMEGEYMKSKHGVIKGAMARELRALVRRCHSAYNAYQAFHEELAPMKDPSPEGLRELHVMREHIVTMKREIYREAKGLLV
ncbi:hypothetical protein E0Z10_g6619 [Xylaria hypoxylon]|uniref:Uncharacterized protein n=1 Tax=Xylaria hypoxylon TaxID=37992 RepID=A0A4Z0YUL6_9PEZI|nr:hypothetical protein E0Z10_g6619 [Xylaria hypoxylon]